MNIITNTDTIPYVIAEDYFEEEQVQKMLSELSMIQHKSEFSLPKNMDEDYKKNKSVSVDHVWSDRDCSPILTNMDLIYHDSILVNEIKNTNYVFNGWYATNSDRTFATFNKKGDYYKPHYDISQYTLMYYLWEEPKSFEGGDIILSTTKQQDDWSVKISIKRNMLVVFPSPTFHEVTELTKGEGRMGVIRFVYTIPDTNPLPEIRMESDEG